MPGTFETGCSSIELDGSPWNVTTAIHLYVIRNSSGQFELYQNAACTVAYSPANLECDYNESTGLYFYIGQPSASDLKFTDGLSGRPLPISWPAQEACPSTVTYGKIKSDRLAFSIRDLAAHTNDVNYTFDLVVELPSGDPQGVSFHLADAFVDPTIIEKGEEPPPK